MSRFSSRFTLIAGLASTSLSLFSGAAHAQTALPLVADTYISVHPDLGSANTNFGSDTRLFTISPSGYYTYSLLKFDVSGISAATSDATLDLYCTLVFSGGAPIRMYQVLTPWSENTVTYNNFGGAPGVQFGTDVALSAFASYGVPTQDVYNRYVIPQAIVQGWINNPGSNNGILLYSDAGRDNVFGSRESGAATAPRIVVNGVGGSATAPEPSAFDLLVLPAFGAIIARRRKNH